jgi:hypothetical protein
VTKQTADIRRWALIGAEQRLVQLAEEAAAIYREFPELRQGRKTAEVPFPRAPREVPFPKRKRRKLSAAGRKAISDAAKKRWAKEKAGKKG